MAQTLCAVLLARCSAVVVADVQRQKQNRRVVVLLRILVCT